jgi:hypothetical protein
MAPEENCETEMSVWIRRLDGQIAVPLIAAINRNIRQLPISERSRDTEVNRRSLVVGRHPPACVAGGVGRVRIPGIVISPTRG